VIPQLIEGLEPWAPSPVKNRNQKYKDDYDHVVPHEMTVEEIQTVLEQFKKGAENAKKAGFDGIELHSANGYLSDQFLRDRTNKRTDDYGGTIEKRCRFTLEVIDQLISVFGPDRTGIRISPTGRFGDMYDSNPLPLYKHLLEKLSEKKIAFLEIKEAGVNDLAAQSTEDEFLPRD